MGPLASRSQMAISSVLSSIANGLRPGRFWITADGLSRTWFRSRKLELDPATIVRKGRLQPGRMFLVDTINGRVIEDDEIKAELAAEHPYQEWLDAGLLHLEDLPDREHVVHTHTSVLRRQQAFGYGRRVADSPDAHGAFGDEALGSMGTDTPIAALSIGPDCCLTTLPNFLLR